MAYNMPMVGNSVEFNAVNGQWVEFYTHPYSQTRHTIGLIYPFYGQDGLFHFVSQLSGVEIVHPMPPSFFNEVIRRSQFQLSQQMHHMANLQQYRAPPPVLHLAPSYPVPPPLHMHNAPPIAGQQSTIPARSDLGNANAGQCPPLPPPPVDDKNQLSVDKLQKESELVLERLAKLAQGTDEFTEELLFKNQRSMADGSLQTDVIPPPNPSKDFKKICMTMKTVAMYLKSLNTIAREKSVSKPFLLSMQLKNAAQEGFSEYQKFADEIEMPPQEFQRWIKIIQECCENPEVQVWNAITSIRSDEEEIKLHLSKFSAEEEVIIDFLLKLLYKDHQNWGNLLKILNEKKMQFLENLLSLTANAFGWNNSTYTETGNCVPIKIAINLNLPSKASADAMVSDVNGTKWKLMEVVKLIVERFLAPAGSPNPSMEGAEKYGDFWKFISAMHNHDKVVAPMVAQVLCHSKRLLMAFMERPEWRAKTKIKFRWTKDFQSGRINMDVLRKTCESNTIPVEEMLEMINSCKHYVDTSQSRLYEPKEIEPFTSACMYKLFQFGVVEIQPSTYDLGRDIRVHLFRSLQVGSDTINSAAFDYFTKHIVLNVMDAYQAGWVPHFLYERSRIGLLVSHIQSARDLINLMMNKPLFGSDSKSVLVFAAHYRNELLLKAFSSDDKEIDLVDSIGERLNRVNLETGKNLNIVRTKFNDAVYNLKKAHKTKIELVVLVEDSREGIMTQCITGDSLAFPDVRSVYTMFSRHILPFINSKEVAHQLGEETTEPIIRVLELMKMLATSPVAYVSLMLTCTNKEEQCQSASSSNSVFDLIPHYIAWPMLFEKAMFKEFVESYVKVGISRVKIPITRLLTCSASRASMKLFLGKGEYGFKAINLLLDEMKVLKEDRVKLFPMLPKQTTLESMGMSPMDIKLHSHFFVMDDVHAESPKNLFANAFIPLSNQEGFLTMVQNVEKLLNKDNTSLKLLGTAPYEEQVKRVSQVIRHLIDNESADEEDAGTVGAVIKTAKKFNVDVLSRVDPAILDVRLFSGTVFECKGIHHRCSGLWNLFDLQTGKFGFRHFRTTNALEAFVKCYAMTIPEQLEPVLGLVNPAQNVMKDIMVEQFFATFLHTFLFHSDRHADLELQPTKPFVSTVLSSIFKTLSPENMSRDEDQSSFILKCAFIKPLTSQLRSVEHQIHSPELHYLFTCRPLPVFNLYQNKGSGYTFDNAAALKGFMQKTRRKNFTLKDCLTALQFPDASLNEFNIEEANLQACLMCSSLTGGFPIHLTRPKTETGITSQLSPWS